ncbi:MAG: branched-chain amino acid ABC transporter permease, partial [Mesorhizobium sp.]
GAVAGAFYPTSPTMAQELGMIIFVVVVVGGLGSIHGALVASLLIGVMSSFAIGLDWTLADALRSFGMTQGAGQSGILTVRLSSLAGALPFLFMLITLLVRPAGLFGDKTQA